MKKATAIVLALFLLTLTACGGGSAPAGQSPAAQSPAASAGQSPADQAPAAPAQTYELKINSAQSETDLLSIGLTEWAQILEEESNGELVVEVFYNNALGENDDVVEQCIAGAPIIAGTDPSRLATYVPDYGIVAMPYLFDDYTAINKLVETPTYASWVEALEPHGIKLIAGNGYSGTRNFLTNKVVNVPADLNGLRIRTIGNEICTNSINAMGAVATPMPWSEVYQAIQLKALEGAEVQSPSIYSSKMYEVCSVLNKTKHFELIACFVMGADYFNSLPEHLQEIILRTGKDMGISLQEGVITQSDEFEKEMVEKHGMTINEIADLTPFIEATEPIYAQLGYEVLRDQLLSEIEAVK